MLRDQDGAKEAEIQRLRSKSPAPVLDSNNRYTADRAPPNVSLKLELQRQEEVGLRLEKRLDVVIRS